MCSENSDSSVRERLYSWIEEKSRQNGYSPTFLAEVLRIGSAKELIALLLERVLFLHREHFISQKMKSEWEQHSVELALLQDLSKKINALHKVPAILELLASFVERLFISVGTVVFLQSEKEPTEFNAAYSNLSKEEVDKVRHMLTSGQLDWVISDRNPVVIPHVVSLSGEKEQCYEGSIVAVPLWSPSKTIGVMVVLSKLPRHSFFEKDLEIAAMITNTISVALENALLYARMEKKIRDLSILVEAGKAMSSVLELDELLKLIVTLATHVSSWNAGLFLLLNEASGKLEPSSSIGLARDLVNEFFIAPGQGITGWCAKRQDAVLINKRNRDSFPAGTPEFDLFGGKTIFAIPLVNKSRLLGVLALFDKQERTTLPEDEIEMLLSLAANASITVDNVRLYRESQQLAVEDDLTHLYNARYFKQHVEQALEQCHLRGHTFSVIFLDLDGFKEINDTYGHQKGSWALMEVGQIINTLVSDEDVICRYGGDEFIIARQSGTADEALALAERIRRFIEIYEFLKDFDINHHLTASIGVATFPHHAKSADTLIELADRFMYEAKRAGKNQVFLADSRVVE